MQSLRIILRANWERFLKMGKEVHKHLLLCAKPTKQKCFKGIEGQKTWECLKKTLKKFETHPSTKNLHILRSKADCLRICKNGPILLVWPDGIWYEKVSPERISEIFTSHIINGKPIEKWIFKKTPFLNSPRYS